MHARIDHLLSLRDRLPTEAWVPEHVGQCPACAAQLRRLENTRSRLQSLPQSDAPAGSWDAIRSKLDVAAAPSWQHRVRIGVAVSNASQTLASPYENYNRRTKALDADYFARLAKDERITRFVVGLPVHTSGRESEKSVEAKAFGAWLGELTGLPVDFFDERYTTSIAQQMLSEMNVPKTKRKEKLDKLAAQILLTHLHNRQIARLETQLGAAKN